MEQLLAIAKSLTLPKGTVLMQEGKSHDCFYILMKSSAKAFQWKDGEISCSWFAFENDVLATMGVPGAVLSGYDATHAALTSTAKGK